MLLANISLCQINTVMQTAEQKLHYSKKSSILDVKYHRAKKNLFQAQAKIFSFKLRILNKSYEFKS